MNEKSLITPEIEEALLQEFKEEFPIAVSAARALEFLTNKLGVPKTERSHVLQEYNASERVQSAHQALSKKRAQEIRTRKSDAIHTDGSTGRKTSSMGSDDDQHGGQANRSEKYTDQ
jgi:hypothetical protein